mgnify:CR=1 FL=1
MTMAPEHARVRSYLVTQAEKLSVAEIWAKVEASFVELSQSVSGNITPAQLTFKPGPEEWSIVEVMSHLLSSNINTCRTVVALARGKELSRDTGERGSLSAADDFLTLVAVNREAVIHSVRELPESLELEPTLPHGMFGPLNCKAWLLFIRLHNLDHASQVKKNRQQQNYPR